MIVLFTDFGLEGPYVGQMKAVLHRDAPGVPIIDLFSDAPAFDIAAAAHLLAAYVSEFATDTVFLCVVDPGVGTASREPVIARIDERWFVGPDNGIFDIVAARAEQAAWRHVLWRPVSLSASFHGRDLFAPVAARLATREIVDSRPAPDRERMAGDELARVIYIDRFGNAMTGLRGEKLAHNALVEAGGYRLRRARTFGEVAPGEAFWHDNANGLVEIAVNQGRACDALNLKIATPIKIV